MKSTTVKTFLRLILLCSGKQKYGQCRVSGLYTFDGSISSSYNWWSLSKLHILFDRDLIFTCLYIQLPLMYLLGIQIHRIAAYKIMRHHAASDCHPYILCICVSIGPFLNQMA